MELSKEELQRKKVDDFIKEANELQEKHGLYFKPAIEISENGIIPKINIGIISKEDKEVK